MGRLDDADREHDAHPHVSCMEQSDTENKSRSHRIRDQGSSFRAIAKVRALYKVKPTATKAARLAARCRPLQTITHDTATSAGAPRAPTGFATATPTKLYDLENTGAAGSIAGYASICD
jgi:hypothetical protein